MTRTRKEILIADKAPKAIGPYSLGVRAGRFVFVSGTIGVDPATGEFVQGGIEAETRQTLQNLAHILEAGGSSMDLVVKTTVFMRDMQEFQQMNAVYAEFFKQDPPARSTLQVAALPKGAAVEVEAVALVARTAGD